MGNVGEDEGEDDGDDGDDHHDDPAEEAGVGAVAVDRVSVTGAGEQFVSPGPQLAVFSGDAGPHGGHHRHADEAVLDQAGVEVGAGEAGEGEDDGPVTNHLLINSIANLAGVGDVEVTETRRGEVVRVPGQPLPEVSEVPRVTGLLGLPDESPQPERNIADQEVTQS